MGYGISADERRGLETLSESLLNRCDAPPPDAIVVDLNATIRFCILGADRSSLCVARALLKRVCGGAPKCSVYVVADDPRRMHAARSALYQTRYKPLTTVQASAKAAAGYEIIGNRAFKPGETPLSQDELDAIDVCDVRAALPWTRMMQSARGKHVAISCAIRGLIYLAQSEVFSDSFRLFLWHDDAPYLFPRVWPRAIADDICDNEYGEADQRVTECIRAIQHRRPDTSIWVFTIDTDMLLQAIVAPFRTEGSVTLFLKTETVDLLKWRLFWGDSDDVRASSALFLILAGGCDYNTGFTPYGYFKKDIFTAARQASVSEPFARLSREDDTFSIHLGKFRRALKGVVRRRPKKRPRDPFSLEDELSNAVFTIALFSGIQRKTGGPPATRFSFLEQMSADCDPIEGLFSAPCELTQLCL